MGFTSWVIIAGALLLLFVIVMLLGIVRRSLNTIMLSILLCLLGAGASCVAAFKFLKAGHATVKYALKGRSAMEVYTAVFGTPAPECVQILDYYDSRVPLMDDDVVICFKACPAEVARILSRRRYTIEKQSLQSVSAGQHCTSCFTAAQFGNTVFAASGKDQHLYFSPDSLHVFYRGVTD